MPPLKSTDQNNNQNESSGSEPLPTTSTEPSLMPQFTPATPQEANIRSNEPLKPKKSGKRRAVLILLLLVILSGTGAAAYLLTRPETPTPQSPTHNQVLEPQTTPNISTNDLSKARTEMGIKLLQQLSNSNDSVFISPTSISTALTMVQAGAKNQTKNEIRSALQLGDIDDEELNTKNLAIQQRLTQSSSDVMTNIANSAWIDDKFSVEPSYVALLKDSYMAEVQNLDLQATGSAEKIDDWVKQKTNNKIQAIAPNPIPNDYVMMLINAVYFKGTWKYQFDEADTKNREFTAADGSKKDTPLMTLESEDLKYYEEDGLQAIELPYGKEGKYAMNVVLPDNLDAYLKELDNEKLNATLGKLKQKEGTLLLPRFKLEYDTSLVKPLQLLGAKTAFSDSADFSGIGRGLKISEVKHKTFVEVNEEGTEAAAVTSIGIATESVGPSTDRYYMEVNKPFFLIIRDVESGEPLFMGAIKKV